MRTDLYDESIERATNFIDTAEQNQKIVTLRKCFKKLKIPFQDIVTLCGFEGKSYQETSEALSVPIGTVRSRLNKARLLLSACLEKNGVMK